MRPVYIALAAVLQLLAWFLGGIGILGILMAWFPDSITMHPWYTGPVCFGGACVFQWLALDAFKEASK